MSTLVERLRSYKPHYRCDCWYLAEEAADRIEALEAENARLREALKPFSDAVFYDNGDVTVSIPTGTEPYLQAYYTLLLARREADIRAVSAEAYAHGKADGWVEGHAEVMTEREACAHLFPCAPEHETNPQYRAGWNDGVLAMRSAIRARGQTP